MNRLPSFVFQGENTTRILTVYLLVGLTICQGLLVVGLDEVLAKALVVELMGEFAYLE